MPYIPFTDEQKTAANTVDLVRFLHMRGEKLERVGREHKLIYYDRCGKHDSITIRGSTWFDHKNQTGGGAIKFMQEFYGMDFQIAVQELLGYSVTPLERKEISSIKAKEKKPFILPPKNKTMHRVYAYLIKQRYIAADVITHFAKAGTIFEDAEHHNAVFVGLDKNGIPRQASKRSTSSMGKTFRITCEGSDTRYSFAHFGTSDKLFVFEAPIDMLSYITMHPKNWQQDSYLALNGVYENAVLCALEEHKYLDKIYLCTDNDEGGIDGADRIRDILSEKGFENVFRLCPRNKDWNEDLKELHGQSALPAAVHRRKSFYYSFAQKLTHYKCRPDRLSQQLNEAFKNAQYKYLAECALAGSAFFMRVKDESKGFCTLKKKLVKSYRAYSDKGRKSVKQRALADKMREVQSDLKQTARTQEQSLATAKKLFELADCAVKISVEEAMEQEQEEQTESEDQDLAPPVLS